VLLVSFYVFSGEAQVFEYNRVTALCGGLPFSPRDFPGKGSVALKRDFSDLGLAMLYYSRERLPDFAAYPQIITLN
jgi:hypothetical protein